MRLRSGTRQGLRSRTGRPPSDFANVLLLERASLARPTWTVGTVELGLRRTSCPRIRLAGVLESRSIGVVRPTAIALACLFLCSAPTLFAMSRTLEEANRHKISLIWRLELCFFTPHQSWFPHFQSLSAPDDGDSGRTHLQIPKYALCV